VRQLNAQPMGFYSPSTLDRRRGAQRRLDLAHRREPQPVGLRLELSSSRSAGSSGAGSTMPDQATQAGQLAGRALQAVGRTMGFRYVKGLARASKICSRRCRGRCAPSKLCPVSRLPLRGS